MPSYLRRSNSRAFPRPSEVELAPRPYTHRQAPNSLYFLASVGRWNFNGRPLGPQQKFNSAAGVPVISLPSFAVNTGVNFAGQDTGQALTLVLVATPTASSASADSKLLGFRRNDQKGWHGIRSGDGTVRRWNFAVDFTSQVIAPTDWTAGTRYGIVLVARRITFGSARCALFINGELVAEAAFWDQGSYATTDHVVLGSASSLPDTEFAAAFQEIWPDDFAAGVSAEPQILFEPRQIWVPQSAGGPSMPTLSLPTVTAIGATQATPRVTLTY